MARRNFIKDRDGDIWVYNSKAGQWERTAIDARTGVPMAASNRGSSGKNHLTVQSVNQAHATILAGKAQSGTDITDLAEAWEKGSTAMGMVDRISPMVLTEADEAIISTDYGEITRSNTASVGDEVTWAEYTVDARALSNMLKRIDELENELARYEWSDD